MCALRCWIDWFSCGFYFWRITQKTLWVQQWRWLTSWGTILGWITTHWRGAATAKHPLIKGAASWTPPLGKCQAEIGLWFHSVPQENWKVKKKNIFQHLLNLFAVILLKVKKLNVIRAQHVLLHLSISRLTIWETKSAVSNWLILKQTNPRPSKLRCKC